MISHFWHSFVVGSLVILIGAGCDLPLLTDISQLKNNQIEMKRQLEILREELNQVERNVALLKISRDEYNSAVIDPASGEGFIRLDSSVGSFTLSIQDVKPHADGVKIRLEVGNLTSATVNGGTFKVKWGPRMPNPEDKDFFALHESWRKGLRETEHEFTDNLRPGAWNKVILTLPGIPPDELGYLEISIETNKISLLKPQ